jgi:hypothetical protein
MSAIVDAAKRFAGLRKPEDDYTEEMTTPTIAMLPPPSMAVVPDGPAAPPDLDSNDVLTNAIVARANALKFLEDVKREQQKLSVQLAETVLELERERRKVKVQEQDLADRHLTIVEQQNTIASLQLELTEKNKVWSVAMQYLAKWGIQPPPKKERKPRIKKKADREGADPAPQPPPE